MRDEKNIKILEDMLKTVIDVEYRLKEYINGESEQDVEYVEIPSHEYNGLRAEELYVIDDTQTRSSSEWTRQYSKFRGVEDLDFVNEDVHEFADTTYQMLRLYSRKNMDYGGAFDKSLDEDGLLVAKIRLGDKLSRFNYLINNPASVSDETIEDTLIDLANYAVMTLMWIRKGWKENVSNES